MISMKLEGKYPTWARYYLAKARRWPIRRAIAPLVRWKPINQPKEGYSILIACHANLASIMIASLRMLAAQDLSRLDRTFIAFDAPRNEDSPAFERRLAEEFPGLRITCLYQTPLQSRVLRAINWGWVDCWLSYCLAMAQVETRHVMLHDMDAILLRPRLVEDRYDAIREGGSAFLGVTWYAGNGVQFEDRTVHIVDMFLDAELIRSNFRPLDLFNDVTILNGRSVDFDILLLPQIKTDRSQVLPLTKFDWVHPSQVISQYTYLRRSKNYVPPPYNNLWFIPYFLDLAGNDPGLLDDQARAILNSEPESMPILDCRMDMRRMTPSHMSWIIDQVARIERAMGHGIRENVKRYLDAIQSRCAGMPEESLYEQIRAEIDAEESEREGEQSFSAELHQSDATMDRRR